jgi:AcrR family transcriptional regulator
MDNGSRIKVSSRLSSGERRQAIIEAVKDVFAKKGFDRTTSGDLAKAARVSEALLYKYFPTKLSLYNAMLGACAKAPGWLVSNHLQALKPSTATLIIMVDSLMSQFIESAYSDGAVLGRLAVRSLLEDGDFVRSLLKPFADTWVAVFEKCLRKAAANGDLRELPATPDVSAWFVHHIAFGLMLHLAPKSSPIDYNVPKHRLVQEAVCFALRGIGLKEQPIQRHYNSSSMRRGGIPRTIPGQVFYVKDE